MNLAIKTSFVQLAGLCLTCYETKETSFLQYDSYHKTIIPEDQWSCKRSPDYFPGITSIVKREKGATLIFLMLKSSQLCGP